MKLRARFVDKCQKAGALILKAQIKRAMPQTRFPSDILRSRRVTAALDEDFSGHRLYAIEAIGASARKSFDSVSHMHPLAYPFA